ncbi:hypothetical protein FSP39_002770 [Pinctada imbricata]|uniref:Uncharacterized protein n=1 Tax=Pinctada imbricata TaxID=66713 RepID=A0AA88XRE1_PINIB|nr:hypothetical protein FSP39_002770 [Pinctada imbricata]
MVVMSRVSVFSFVCLVSFVHYCGCQVDRTRQRDAYGQLVVDTTLEILRDSCIVQDHLFLRRLAYFESNFGIKNSFGSNNGGIWRVTKAMFNVTKSASSRLQPLLTKIKTSLGVDWSTLTYDDMRTPLYSALAAVMYIDNVSLEPIPAKLEYQAAFWQKYYNPVGDTNQFTATIQTLIEGCSNANQADIVFILETSSRMTVKDLAQAKNLMTTIINELNIAPNLTRVALVTFGSSAQVKLHLNTKTDKSGIISEINKLISTSGSVNTIDALKITRNEVFKESNGARKEASHTTILLTKSRPDDPVGVTMESSLFTGSGSVLYVLGVGVGGNDSSLRDSASSPQCGHFIHASTFDELMNHEAEIMEKNCEEAALLHDGIYLYPCNVDALIKVPYSPYGHHITVTLSKGERTLYGSSSYKLPDETIYDVKETVSPKSPWTIFWKNHSDFFVNVKSTFGQTCTGTYRVNVTVGQHTTVPPSTTIQTTTSHTTGQIGCNFGNNKNVAPHPSDPTRFYLCDPKGQRLTVQCPPKEWFCTATNMCEKNCSVPPGSISKSPGVPSPPTQSTGPHIVLVFTTKSFAGTASGLSTPGIFIRTTTPNSTGQTNTGVPAPTSAPNGVIQPLTTPGASKIHLVFSHPQQTFAAGATPIQTAFPTPSSGASKIHLVFGQSSQAPLPATAAVHTTQSSATAAAVHTTQNSQHTTSSCNKNPCTADALLRGELLFAACDESSFYHCSGLVGGAQLEHCPTDKIFNPAINGCVNKYVFDENSRQLVKNIKNPCKNVTGDAFFAHPLDQTKFIHCDGHWNGFMSSCPSGEVYFALSNTCIGAAVVG